MSEAIRQVGNDGENGYLLIGNNHKAVGPRWKLVSNDKHILAGVDHNGNSPVNFFLSEKLLMFGDGNVLYVTDDPNSSIGSIKKFNIREVHADNELACNLRQTLEFSGYGLLLEAHK